MLSTSLTEQADTAEKQTYWILRFLRYSRMNKFPPGWREQAYKLILELRECHGPDGSIERRKAHDFLLDAIQRTCEERLNCIKRLALPAHVRRDEEIEPAAGHVGNLSGTPRAIVEFRSGGAAVDVGLNLLGIGARAVVLAAHRLNSFIRQSESRRERLFSRYQQKYQQIGRLGSEENKR